MNEHAFLALEFPKIRERVLAYLQSPAGSREALDWGPGATEEAVRRLVDETSQARELADEESPLDLAGAVSPREILKRAKPRDASLTPEEILTVKSLCATARGTRSRLGPLCERFPLLGEPARRIPSLGRLERAIEAVLDEEGDFRDSASPELSAIRTQTASAREEINALCRRLLAEHAGDGTFQEDIVTTRRGRYVLLVRSGQRGRLPGAVLDRSDSGAALYVEPEQAVGLNNRLAELAAGEEREKKRLLRRLTRDIREEGESLEAASAILGSLDLMQARALYGLARKHRKPAFSDRSGLRLVGARHPLLEETGHEVVPLDLRLGEGEKALIITGPNTGGKTVALKTAGLLCLMAQAGLYLPAGEGTMLPVFGNVFADIGDEQSIEQSLSTFSGHVRNIAEAAREAGGGTLVILDELGAGTDPMEGAPLAMAILEHLMERGALTLATTHHGALVAFALTTPGVANASVEFDRKSLRPTFRLIMGVPGRSNAREVARRFGLPGSVVSRSLELQPESERALKDVMENLEKSRTRLEKSSERIGRRQAQLESLVAQREAELERLREERNEVLARTRREAEELLAHARDEVRGILKTREVATGEAHRRMHRLKREIGSALPAEAKRKGRRGSPPATGDTVRLAGLGDTGTVAEVDASRSSARVNVRGKTVEIPLDRLETIEAPAAAGGTGGPRYGKTEEEAESMRLDLRGRRMDEAEGLVERFLDQAWLAGLESVELLHGKGSGVLREVCARCLSRHPGVREFEPARPELGGAGVTVVRFK